MRTWDLYTDDGRTFGVEISNLTISRAGVVRTIRRIPGARIVTGDRYSERRRDDFCHFTIDGSGFVAMEPWGDSARYWIYAEAAAGFEQIEALRHAFAGRRLFAW